MTTKRRICNIRRAEFGSFARKVTIMDESILEDGRITDDGLKKLAERRGKKLRVTVLNELVSKETISRFVNGIGDINPLWTNDEYAAKTSYGSAVAPPNYLYSVCGLGTQHGLPGVQAWHSGDDWEFYRPIYLGDRIRPEFIAKGYEEKKSKGFQGSRMIKQLDERRYYNQRDELVGKANMWIFRIERSSARRTKRYSTLQLPHPWTEERLREIEEEVLDEQIRGSEVQYWEEVEVGEEIPALVKGPLSFTDIIAWLAGASTTIKAHHAALRIFRSHPSWSFRNPDTCALEPIVAVHYSIAAAKSAGVAYPYDVGIQRNAWLIQLFTNWMGDEGFLKRCYSEYRGFVYLSDVIWIRGKVLRKYIDEDGEHCVEIEITAFNQRGENTMVGKGVVCLPSKKDDTWPVRKRVPRDG
jgi:acyl dehydratase